MDARSRFREWMEGAGLSHSACASILGCDRSLVTRTLSGDRMPGRRVANAIERATFALAGGPIRAVDWDTLEDLERARAAVEVVEASQ